VRSKKARAAAALPPWGLLPSCAPLLLLLLLLWLLWLLESLPLPLLLLLLLPSLWLLLLAGSYASSSASCDASWHGSARSVLL
jgi:hypothetical protein